MDRIEIGDTVVVSHVDGDGASHLKGIVRHIPVDVGDMWYIETERALEAINPNCSILIGITKFKDQNK